MSTNLVKIRKVSVEKCPCICGRKLIHESYIKYTIDESRLEAEIPERIYFPETTLQTASAVKDINSRDEKITISGARTGITGGAVNIGTEDLLSVEKLKLYPKIQKTGSRWSVTQGAGNTLEELRIRLLNKEFESDTPPETQLFYPVDPTEASASLGGTLSTNASGARTLYYGPSRDWVKSITVVTSSGNVIKIPRGHYRAEKGVFVFLHPDGTTQKLKIDQVNLPSTKHVAGYPLRDDMDLIDLFIGSEGTLGIITELELFLAERFPGYLNLYVFCDKKINTGKFVLEMKENYPAPLLAFEYMDRNSVKVLKDHRKHFGPATGIPELPDNLLSVFYIESGFRNQEQLFRIEKKLQQVFTDFKLDLNLTWAGFHENTALEMKKFRHALPEKINSIIAGRKASIPELTKTGTDMAVPDSHLCEILEYYYKHLEESGLEYVIFGHIGNSHLHINFLPSNTADLAAARSLYFEFARKVVSLNGSVSAEHGIGKLKRNFLSLQHSDTELDAMRLVKMHFDPEHIFNPGVIL